EAGARNDLDYQTEQRAAPEDIKPTARTLRHMMAGRGFEELLDVQPVVEPQGDLAKFLNHGVAQICNLQYRRIAFCGMSASAGALELSDALPITNRRYGRLQICTTLARLTSVR